MPSTGRSTHGHIARKPVACARRCARCFRLGLECAVIPGYRICVGCTSARCPCVSGRSTPIATFIRARIAAMRNELDALSGALSRSPELANSDDSTIIGADSPSPPSGK